MPFFNLVFWSAFAVLVALSLPQKAHAEAVIKKVCHNDAKGNPVCKTIKTHKKVEGTKVPQKAPVQPKQKK
jgi:hypothetical protein